jgi:hypothetical protein
LVAKFSPSPETCNVASFVDCLWGIPSRERRGDKILWGKCAIDNKCTPELGYRYEEKKMTEEERKATRSAYSVIREKEREINNKMNRLGD